VPDLAGIRVFSGYAGWGADQLEAEIEEGSWYVVSAAPDDLLSADPETLWRRVLRRQPGELAYVSTFPDDPSMN
jgi:putative transcriptional regulator